MRNILFLFSFLFYTLPFYGQTSPVDSLLARDTLVVNDTISQKTIFDLISKEEILEATLEADFEHFLAHKKKMIKYQSGKFSFTDTSGIVQEFKVGIKPRGKYRRKICDFPPLRIKFKKKGLRKLGLNDRFNSLKFVSHCLENKKEGKENILREYLIYKMYNLHSEHSLRAQLAKITYVQKGSGEKLFTRYAILLENENELAHRTHTVVVEKKNCSVDSLLVFGGSVQALFQCMIGNADWSLVHMRNIKLLREPGQKQLHVFPYDFDFSGFVNAGYAIPNPDYHLSNIQQRVFLGKIQDSQEMEKVALHFLERKEATLELCKKFKLLRKKSRKNIIHYLNSFYDMLENETTLNEELLKLSPKK